MNVSLNGCPRRQIRAVAVLDARLLRAKRRVKLTEELVKFFLGRSSEGNIDVLLLAKRRLLTKITFWSLLKVPFKMNLLVKTV